MGNILALDPGYGNTKVCLNGNVNMIQSVVARPRAFGFAAVGMRTISSVCDVTFGEEHFLAGSGAWSWNDPQHPGLSLQPSRWNDVSSSISATAPNP